MSFKVEIDRYSGPYDVLVDLIEEKKLSISEINLGHLADEFLTYIKSNTTSMHERSLFIVIASTLLLLKINSLIPQSAMNELEKKSARSLEDYVRVNQMCRQIARGLNLTGGEMYYVTSKKRQSEILFFPDRYLSIKTLSSVMYLFLNKREKDRVVHSVGLSKTISIEEVMKSLKEKISKMDVLSVKNIINIKASKSEIVGMFIAILMLIHEEGLELSNDNE